MRSGVAFDHSLDDDDRARRLRDLLNEHDGVFDDPDEGASC
jgi:hypothetical protein